jgi:manganese efflux pump family protein
MEIITIILVAIGLSMDAVAVAVSYGLTRKSMNFSDATTLAAWFGGFQALMPLLGWFVGSSLKELITSVDHWIAFFLLAIIGGRMMYDSFFGKGKDIHANSLNISTLLLLSIATSIDALVVGITLGIINVPVIKPIIIIGCITFFLSHIGVLVGKKLGRFFAREVGVVGGLILIAIGTKILLEHLGILS